jgi:hypothetical protein
MAIMCNLKDYDADFTASYNNTDITVMVSPTHQKDEGFPDNYILHDNYP